MKSETKHILVKAAACGFILTLLCSLFPFSASCNELSQHVLRLHVIANSDSENDQKIKLKVRDAVLEESAKWYKGAKTFDEANSAICLHLQSVQNAAQRALTENGSHDIATVKMTEMYFETRDYEKFSLPAGKYRTLRVTIGEGKGKNWWCIVFPALCMPAAQQKQEDVLAALPENEKDIVENPQKYHIKFKAVELYEEFCKAFDR